MRWRAGLAAFVTVLGLAVPTVPAGAATRGLTELRGQAQTPDGQPAPFAEVRIFYPASPGFQPEIVAQPTLDAEGRWSAEVRNGEWWIQAYDPTVRFASSTFAKVTADDGTVQGSTLTVLQPFTVVGTVLRPDGGPLAAGGWVEFFADDGSGTGGSIGVTTFEQDGRFGRRLPPGRYLAAATPDRGDHVESAPVAFTVADSQGAPTRVDPVLRAPNLSARLHQADGRAAGEADLSLDPWVLDLPTVVSADGVTRHALLPEGTYSVTYGYFGAQFIEDTPPVTVQVSGGAASPSQLDLVLPRPNLNVRVLTPGGVSADESFFRLWLWEGSSGSRVSMDDDSWFRTFLPDGTYSLELQVGESPFGPPFPVMYAPMDETRTITVEGGRVTDPGDTVEFQLREFEGPRVTWSVVGPDGAPAVGARVGVHLSLGSGYQTQRVETLVTGTDGVVSTALPDADYEVDVEAAAPRLAGSPAVPITIEGGRQVAGPSRFEVRAANLGGRLLAPSGRLAEEFGSAGVLAHPVDPSPWGGYDQREGVPTERDSRGTGDGTWALALGDGLWELEGWIHEGGVLDQSPSVIVDVVDGVVVGGDAVDLWLVGHLVSRFDEVALSFGPGYDAPERVGQGSVSSDGTLPGQVGPADVQLLVRAPGGQGEVGVTVRPAWTDHDPVASSIGNAFEVRAPQGSSQQPIGLGFGVDVGRLAGTQVVVVRRDGRIVPPCDPASVAPPDPCVTQQSLGGDGILRVEVASSAASRWDVQAVEAEGFGTACPSFFVEPANFSDVSGVHAEAIDCASWWNLVTGRADGTFGPSELVTRAQLASLLVRVADEAWITLPEGQGDSSRFTDIDGNVHEEAIRRLVEAGVANGVSWDRFAPGSPISRGQVAAIVDRFLTVALAGELPGSGQSGGGFDDVGGTAHEPAIDRLDHAGILVGVSANSFAPGAPMSRAQLTTSLTRALNRIVIVRAFRVTG